MELIPFLTMIFTGTAALAAVIAALVAFQIGTRQNEIGTLQDFAEIFLMPQYIVKQEQGGQQVPIGTKILIRNASAYPIYLNGYTLNGIKTDVGSSAVPSDTESWYGVPIPPDIQQKGEFSLFVDFEDYKGRKYRTEGFGVLKGQSWEIKSKKRVEL